MIDGKKMREIGKLITKRLDGLGFALLVFPLSSPGISNYISNGKREDMIKALEETAERLKSKEDFQTPDQNEEN